jgi:predicted acylesterase/phospholipase RssA
VAFTIVSFVGGGIRGLLSATILQRLYDHKPNILTDTDLLAGCSTGSVIVSEITGGVTPEELIALFTGGEVTFYDRQNHDPRKPAYPIDEVIASQVALHGDAKLSDLAQKVLQLSFNVGGIEEVDGIMVPIPWQPILYNNVTSENADTLVAKAVASSGAMPGQLGSVDGNVDGAFVNHDPTIPAIALAVSQGHRLEDIVVICIGTGLMYDWVASDTHRWGARQWMHGDQPVRQHAAVPDQPDRSVAGPGHVPERDVGEPDADVGRDAARAGALREPQSRAALLHPGELDEPAGSRPAPGQGQRRGHRAGEAHARCPLAVDARRPRREVRPTGGGQPVKGRKTDRPTESQASGGEMSTSSAAATSASPGAPTHRAYAIRSLFEGCVMNVSGGSPEPGARVTTGDSEQPPPAEQTWRFVSVEPGWWFIQTAMDTGLVMTLDTELPPNPPVVMEPPRIEDRDAQLWSLVPTAKLGYWYIQSKIAAYVMDVEGFLGGPGVQIIGFARKYDGFENQAWGFAPVG